MAIFIQNLFTLRPFRQLHDPSLTLHLNANCNEQPPLSSTCVLVKNDEDLSNLEHYDASLSNKKIKIERILVSDFQVLLDYARECHSAFYRSIM